MAEVKISDLTPKGSNLIATDLLVISEDVGGGLYETKSITGDEVLNAVAKTAVAVRNQTGATIYKGTIVYISGTSGGKALISKAKADSEATSSKTLGVVTADIANNANGNVLTNGLLTLLDTRTTATHPFTTVTLAIGDDLYLSPITAGYVTNVKPIAPNNLVSIGKVLETSATTGQILYSVVNGYELGELHDVDTTGAVTGNVLALDGSVWKPTAIARNGSGINSFILPKSVNFPNGLVNSSILANNFSNILQTANRITAYPFIPSQTITSTALIVRCAIGVAAALGRVLIYSDLNGEPDTRLYESANLDCSTAGDKTITTAFTFTAGTTYWLAFHSSGAQTMLGIAPTNMISVWANSTTQYNHYYRTFTFGSSPSPLLPDTYNSGTITNISIKL